jgi:cytochrome c peroxidase
VALLVIAASVAALGGASSIIAGPSPQPRVDPNPAAPPGIVTRDWGPEERAALFALSLAELPPPPPDPSNRVADDPRAAALGHRLFFDARLSATGTVSCATCHDPARGFVDDRPTAHGVGPTARRTMPVAGTAHGPWFFWDGRADSPWAQALGPLEAPAEHGITRTRVAHAVAAHYAAAYASVFGPLPVLAGLPRDAGPVEAPAWRAAWDRVPAARQADVTRVYANVGKALAAYERRLTYGASRADRWIAAERAGRAAGAGEALTAEEVAGARLFVGRARCATCHGGARLTDDAFHNTGVAVAAGDARLMRGVDRGRATGAPRAVRGEFACTSRYSDAGPADCDELRFADTAGEGLVRAFKTPSLRDVGRRAPYMHAGQLATLDAVVAHYDRAPAAPAGASELRGLRLSGAARRQLVAFLRALDAPPTAAWPTPAALLTPPPAAAPAAARVPPRSPARAAPR